MMDRSDVDKNRTTKHPTSNNLRAGLSATNGKKNALVQFNNNY